MSESPNSPNSSNSTGPSGSPEQGVPLITEADIVAARQKGRELALGIGFSPGDATLIATAISELARNIVTYAKRGEILHSEGRHQEAVEQLTKALEILAGKVPPELEPAVLRWRGECFFQLHSVRRRRHDGPAPKSDRYFEGQGRVPGDRTQRI